MRGPGFYFGSHKDACATTLVKGTKDVGMSWTEGNRIIQKTSAAEMIVPNALVTLKHKQISVKGQKYSKTHRKLLASIELCGSPYT